MLKFEVLTTKESLQIDEAIKMILLKIAAGVDKNFRQEGIAVSFEQFNGSVMIDMIIFICSIMASKFNMSREHVVAALQKTVEVAKENAIFDQEKLVKEFMTSVEVGGNA